MYNLFQLEKEQHLSYLPALTTGKYRMNSHIDL